MTTSKGDPNPPWIREAASIVQSSRIWVSSPIILGLVTHIVHTALLTRYLQVSRRPEVWRQEDFFDRDPELTARLAVANDAT
jgi:hypothetical protein